MAVEQNKALVRRLIQGAVNHRNLDVLDEVADGEIAGAARRWIGPFRDSFPDFRMDIIDLVAEGDKVVAHLRCSGTDCERSSPEPARNGHSCWYL